MEQLLEESNLMSVENIKNNPAIIADILLKQKDISVLFEKRGEKIGYAYLKAYSKESFEILRDAKEEYKKLKEKGYSRQQAFQNFEQARDEISRYL